MYVCMFIEELNTEIGRGMNKGIVFTCLAIPTPRKSDPT